MTETFYNDPIVEEILSVEQIDDTTVEVNKLVREKVQTNTYDYFFLVQQLATIQADLAAYTTARQTEIAEVEDLLSHFTTIPELPEELSVDTTEY